MDNSINNDKKQVDVIDKFKNKKLNNLKLVNYIVKHVTDKSRDRIKICGEFLQFVADKNLEKKKLQAHNGCNNRFCPMCAWRKARKEALQIGILMQYLQSEHKKRFLFLTLTAPNVKGKNLKNELDKFNLAFKNLMKRKELMAINKGYIRKLEITYNKDADTYHPHFHVLIAVNGSYFKDTKIYINHDTFLNLWRECMEDPSITQVDVRAVGENTLLHNGSVAEISKYCAKDNDYLVSQEVFDVFYTSLKGRRILSYNGLFKDSVNLYKKGKLDYLKAIDTTEYIYFLLYRWGFGEYAEAERRELTEEERKKVNKHLIDEAEV